MYHLQKHRHQHVFTAAVTHDSSIEADVAVYMLQNTEKMTTMITIRRVVMIILYFTSKLEVNCLSLDCYPRIGENFYAR